MFKIPLYQSMQILHILSTDNLIIVKYVSLSIFFGNRQHIFPLLLQDCPSPTSGKLCTTPIHNMYSTKGRYGNEHRCYQGGDRAVCQYSVNFQILMEQSSEHDARRSGSFGCHLMPLTSWECAFRWIATCWNVGLFLSLMLKSCWNTLIQSSPAAVAMTSLTGDQWTS